MQTKPTTNKNKKQTENKKIKLYKNINKNNHNTLTTIKTQH